MKEFSDAIMNYLNRVMSYDPIVVAVQLFLIGVIVWWVKRFLQGTRGARMLKGTALLLATVYVVVRLLPRNDEWKRIEFLYGNFLLFVGIAAIVAFQPELRRALVQIGQTTIFRTASSRIEKMIAELAESAAYLSRNKMGAIIAIERSVGLGGYVETGTVINSDVTANLINTIFFPGSILHDMGVIVRDGKIIAAGCQFPLAEGEEMEQSFGSRHRAALGLAQETDAIVLVVSEETGRISLACDGQLSVGLGVESLKEMLMAMLTARASDRRKQKSAAEGEK